MTRCSLGSKKLRYYSRKLGRSFVRGFVRGNTNHRIDLWDTDGNEISVFKSKVDIVKETRNITSVQRMGGESHADLLKVLPEVLKSGVADWLFKSKVNRDVKDKSS